MKTMRKITLAALAALALTGPALAEDGPNPVRDLYETSRLATTRGPLDVDYTSSLRAERPAAARETAVEDFREAQLRNTAR
jgi:hypothetical protein